MNMFRLFELEETVITMGYVDIVNEGPKNGYAVYPHGERNHPLYRTFSKEKAIHFAERFKWV